MFGPGYWGPPGIYETVRRGGAIGAGKRWYVQQALAEQRDREFTIRLQEERRLELSREFRRVYERIVVEQRDEAETKQRHGAMVAVLMAEL